MGSMDKGKAMLRIIIFLLEMEITMVLTQTVFSSNIVSNAEDWAPQGTAEKDGRFASNGSLIASPTSSSSILSKTLNNASFVQRCFDGPIPDPHYLVECCREQYLAYYYHWYRGGYYLTTILEQLQRWNCTEFEEECGTPTWPFSPFTKLMYSRFCDHDLLERECMVTVREIVQRYGFIKPHGDKVDITETRWSVLIESLISPQLGAKDFTKPCIQVALFDRKDGGVGRFHEIVEPSFPFCGSQWSGYDYYSAVYRGVSPWTGISSWCQGSIILCMVVMMLLCVATIIANSIILRVFCTTAKLRNSQAIYKISLAVADLLVGVIVWPSMIIMQYLTFFKPRSMRRIVTPPNNSTTRNVFFPFGNMTLEHRLSGGDDHLVIPHQYVLFSGFFTFLALVISVYTVMWASFDRYWAIFKPLKYNRHIAKKHAEISCVVLWAVALVVAVLPTCVKDMEYHVMSAILITPLDSELAVAFIFLVLVFPLVITWIITIRTFHVSRVHAKARKRITSADSCKSNALERRLTKTLSLMVGTFTLCVFPVLLCCVAGFVIPHISTWTAIKTANLTSFNTYTTCEYIAAIVLNSNSLWNCFIYSVRTVEFRQAAKAIFKDMLERSGMTRIVPCARKKKFQETSRLVGVMHVTESGSLRFFCEIICKSLKNQLHLVRVRSGHCNLHRPRIHLMIYHSSNNKFGKG